ncbi:sugar transporter ERD6 isoform X1 [Eutrema salsugineum]|uniref:sugar transporter ERD6 isoform X1 n=1 Tax=Eutrema salsugineum TaxID=72664 RepID=UPI000CECF7F7|nr:sugar transporter ERD6 isoform X1 [Eutrema salsugineum]
MERQKSMEKGLLRKSLSIRERKFPNEDVFLEAGLSRKSPREIIKKAQNDDGDCRVTASVFLSTFVAVAGSFCTGCGAGFSSGAQAGITKDLSLSVAEYSMFGSILTLGGLIGAIFSGKVADVLGRKRTMLFCEAFCITGWLAVAFAQDALWLDCGRLLLGIGVGLFSYVIPVYIAEIAPKHVRGSFVFANQLMQNCGIALFFIIGNFLPWRLLATVGMIMSRCYNLLIQKMTRYNLNRSIFNIMFCMFPGFVPCVLHVFCLFFIPESPRWLAKKGRDKECRSALQRLRGSDVDISREANIIRDTIEISELDGETGMTELFQRRYAYPLVIGVGLMFLQQLSGSSGMTYYASSLFQKGGFPSAVGTSVIATIMVPKAMLGTIIVDKLGRRTLLMASCAAMGFSALLLSVSYGFQSFGILPDLTPIFTCIGVLGHIVSFAMGMGGLPWIIMAEIFPMNVKVSAGTLVTVTNWLFGWVVTYTFNFMLQWNASGMFFIFSMVSASSIVFIYFLVPETKGRSLEEIQALLSNSVQ